MSLFNMLFGDTTAATAVEYLSTPARTQSSWLYSKYKRQPLVKYWASGTGKRWKKNENK